MSNEAGKRYQCPHCGGQLICIVPGNGTVTCCGEPMAMVDADPLPSAD